MLDCLTRVTVPLRCGEVGRASISEVNIDSGSRQPGFKFQFGLLDRVALAERFLQFLCLIFSVSKIVPKYQAP